MTTPTRLAPNGLLTPSGWRPHGPDQIAFFAVCPHGNNALWTATRDPRGTTSSTTTEPNCTCAETPTQKAGRGQ